MMLPYRTPLPHLIKSIPNSALKRYGQGSQCIGMGKDLYKSYKVVREIHEEVDECLKFSLTKLIHDGLQIDLDMTENAQPALVVHAYAVTAALNSELGSHALDKARFILGHSVGEICALTCANSIEIGNAVRLAKFRGQSMQKSIPTGITPSMVALYPISETDAMDLVQEVHETTGEPIDVANINSPQQIVISGSLDGVESVIDLGKKRGLFRRSTALHVSAPFHSRLMKSAEKAVEEYLLNTDIVKQPMVEMVANLTGSPFANPRDITNTLIKSISKPVRFSDCVSYCHNQGCTDFIEIGPRKTLGPLVTQNNSNLNVRFVASPKEIEELLAVLG